MGNPLIIALKGKGLKTFINRARSISARYGLTTAKMDGALRQFAQILQYHQAGATFPITAAPLARNGALIARYQAHNIEFAIHGLYHVDYSQLNHVEQTAHLQQARRLFDQAGIKLAGFRCPYLRWNDATPVAVAQNGLSYDSSQALYWDVLDQQDTAAYQYVLKFYRAQSASSYPALPTLKGQTVQIPYSLPDDEALIERLKLTDTQAMSHIWRAILEQTYQLGELFTLGLHPERIGLLVKPLNDTLAQARQMSPSVWLARLDQLAAWWLARRETTFQVTSTGPNQHTLNVNGPAGLTLLTRGVAVNAPTAAWTGRYRQVQATAFNFEADRWPAIAVSPRSDSALVEFLKQQGYWVEITPQSQLYTLQLDRPTFTQTDQRPLLVELEENDAQLIRAGRWPHGAQSALCVTGDIDALTLWDYGLRLLGK